MAAARTESNAPLSELLAAALPQGAKFTYYHISTPPTKCSAIFSAPPGARPERTYCESHFLNVSITPEDAQQEQEEEGSKKTAGEVFIFAIEVLIYTTSHLTTIFVSKADSTGYLSLLNLPRSSNSPIRAISTTFIAWLVRHRQRPGTRLVVSLFARAQDQYLFPGSIENASKHVADDTALVKWWCKVLDPVVRAYTPEPSSSSKAETDSEAAAEQQQQQQQASTTAQGYLIIPGLERNETQRFFPPSARSDPPNQKRWHHGHPLLDISPHPTAPPRCLIPHFPDDPKARYMDELDDELPDGGAATVTSPSRGTGQWRSVRSLEQFWEMMSFRQECSSGRLVGFIWVLFTPADVVDANAASSDNDVLSDAGADSSTTTTNSASLAQMLAQPPTTATAKNKASPPFTAARPRRRSSKLTGPIVPRLPRIKSSATAPSSSSSSSSTISNSSAPIPTTTSTTTTTTADPTANIPESTKHYAWPPASRAPLVLADKDYRRATDLLLHHNFADRAIAAVSTRRWVEEVGVLGRSKGGAWGVAVAGRRGEERAVRADGAEGVNVLVGVRRKKRGGEEVEGTRGEGGGGAEPEPGPGPERNGVDGGVNVLTAGLVRKKPKTDGAAGAAGAAVGGEGQTAAAADAGKVNVLAGNLVRKKPKA